MEDSLEDFLRFSKNSKQKNKNEQSDKLRSTLITLQKKKEAETRAMKIVEFMIEGRLRGETFFHCLLHINQQYYQDVVEERALNKICGYALCSQKLSEMPAKKYHISSKLNKVYDITDRKNYCSNYCYTASLHVKKQIEITPLWLRSNDKTPEFRLLPLDSRKFPGEEIGQGIAKPVEDDPQFTSIHSFTEASLDELAENEIINTKKQKLETLSKTSEMAVIPESEEFEDKKTKARDKENVNYQKLMNKISIQGSQYTSTKENCEESKEIQPNTSKLENNTLDVNADETLPKTRSSLFSKKRKMQTKTSTSSTGETKVHKNSVNVLEHINTCVREWITIETFVFLHGREKIAETLSNERLNTLLGSLKLSENKNLQQLKYVELCKIVQLKEIEDEKFDKSVVGKELKPLPDYEKLKEESEKLKLIVRSFYDGVPYEIDKEINRNSTSGTNDKEGGDVYAKEVEEVQDKEEEEEGQPAVLPLVDVNSQNALRRKVFLNSLNKVLQNFAELLHFSMYNIQNDVLALTKTFKLSPNNVVFKPLLWNIIGIVILKVLSLKNGYLREIMGSSRSEHHIGQILKPFSNSEDFLRAILFTFNNVEDFLERYVQNDVMQ